MLFLLTLMATRYLIHVCLIQARQPHSQLPSPPATYYIYMYNVGYINIVGCSDFNNFMDGKWSLIASKLVKNLAIKSLWFLSCFFFVSRLVSGLFMKRIGLSFFSFRCFRALQNTIPKNVNKYSQKRNIAASVPISTFMCRCAIYIFPWSVCLFCCRKICGPILGIYKSLTDTWMWKLGLRQRNSFSGNT